MRRAIAVAVTIALAIDRCLPRMHLPRFKKFRPGILSWLFALVLLTGLPLVGYLIYTVRSLGEQHQDFVLANMERRSESLSGEVSQLVGRSVGVLSALANSDEVAQGDLRSLYDYAQRIILTNEAFRAITLVDAQDRMAFFTLLPFGGDMPVPGQLDVHHQVLQTGKPQTLGVFPSPVAARVVTAVAVPVFKGGQVAFSLRMIILPEHLSRLLIAQRLPPDWIAVLSDAQGRTLARSKDPREYVGKPAGPELAAAIQRGGVQHFSATTRDGILVRAVVRPVEGTSWFMTLGVPEASLYTPVNRSLNQAYAAGFLALAVSLVLAYLFSRWLAREARWVVESALGVRNGNLPAPMTHRVGEFARLRSWMEDIHLAREDSEQALQLARQDPLTGLAGRARFEQAVARMGARLTQTGHGSLALFFVDIDNFKQVNDTQGHDTGDQVLVQVAEAMRHVTRDGDLLARLGGDEFCLCITGEEGLEARSRALAEALLVSIAQIGHGIGCSIGVALCKPPFPGLAPLLREADQAMYVAKRQGKNRYIVATVSTAAAQAS